MGYPYWKEFVYPQVKRMYDTVKRVGRYVSIHSCGEVDELFDDLIGIGVDIFNPFQPEVMGVSELLREYHGRLTFYGGLSTQKTLPYGSTDDVVNETPNAYWNLARMAATSFRRPITLKGMSR